MANIELDGANKKITVDSGDLTLDIPGDIILDADGGDITFADGGTNLLKITNSSSDVVFQPQVDAKDIIFKQYDGTNLLEINDGGYVAIANGATGPGQLRLYEDTDNGTNYTAFQVGTQSGDVTYTLPTADGSNGQFLSTNGSGTLSWGTVSSGVALDDVSTGDAASTLATSAGNITVDAQGDDTDIIFKGTDGGADTTFWTMDGSDKGNLVPGSTSTGIYLGVNSATASNLLDDYEEGTWTPTFQNYSGTDQTASGEYTKIGELVIAGGRIGTDGTSDGSTPEIAGLPFTISNDPAINGHGGASINFTTASAHYWQTVNNTSYIQANTNVGAGLNYNDWGHNKEVRFTIIYKVA